jgi:hypothetical protein
MVALGLLSSPAEAVVVVVSVSVLVGVHVVLPPSNNLG